MNNDKTVPLSEVQKMLLYIGDLVGVDNQPNKNFEWWKTNTIFILRMIGLMITNNEINTLVNALMHNSELDLTFADGIFVAKELESERYKSVIEFLIAKLRKNNPNTAEFKMNQIYSDPTWPT